MFSLKPSNDGLHDCPTHEVRLASHPEPLAVDSECLRLPLIQPESQSCSPLNPVLTNRSASQCRREFYAKVYGKAIQWAWENCDLL